MAGEWGMWKAMLIAALIAQVAQKVSASTSLTKVTLDGVNFFRLRDENDTKSTEADFTATESFDAAAHLPQNRNRNLENHNRRRANQREQIRFASFNQMRPSSVNVQQGPFKDSKQVFPVKRSDLVKAHLVTKEINLHSPTIRVLFHAVSPSDSPSSSSSPELCITLNASLRLQSSSPDSVVMISERCSLLSRSSATICEIMVPGHWWKKVGAAKGKSAKHKKNLAMAKILYSSMEGSECSDATYVDNMLELDEKVSLLPPENLVDSIHKNQLVHINVLPKNIVPGSKLYIPISLNTSHWRAMRSQGLNGIKIRCRLPPGMKLMSIDEVKTSSEWRVNTFINKRHSLGEMIVLPKQQTKEGIIADSADDTPIEDFFHCLLSVDENVLDLKSSGAITWHVSYIKPAATPPVDENLTLVDDGHKIVTKVQLQKDAVQAVLPLLQTSELLNLATLTGQLQSEPLKVFIVSSAGRLADVTSQSSCQSRDNSVIKVSPSCNSIYVDGSENRGALRAAIEVSYGTYQGLVEVVVWTPRFPLNVVLEDKRLSKIRDWKTCRGEGDRKKERDKTFLGKGKTFSSLYQQTKVRVFTHFVAEDTESGRQNFFPSRFSEVEVTDLVKGNLNARDGHLVRVEGDLVKGKSPGETKIQVISPLNGEVLGKESIQVNSDEELVTRVDAQIVSDVDVSVESRPMGSDNRAAVLHIINTNVLNKLEAQYEEGFLDVALRFSDDSVTPLSDLDPAVYAISMKSLQPASVAVVYPEDSNYPHVVALANCSGPVVRIDIKTSPMCGPQKMIASAMVEVEIAIPAKEMNNPGYGRSTTVPAGVLSEIPLKDQQEPSTGAGNEAWAISSHPKRRPSEMIHFNSMESMMSLETVAYAVLALFGASVSMILAACYIPSLRYRDVLPWKKKEMLSSSANEWVWLGSMKKGEQFEGNRVNKVTTVHAEAPLWSTVSKGTERSRSMTTATTTPGELSTSGYPMESPSERHRNPLPPPTNISPGRPPHAQPNTNNFATYSVELRNSFAQRMHDIEAAGEVPNSPHRRDSPLSTPDSDVSNFALVAAHQSQSRRDNNISCSSSVVGYQPQPIRQSPASAFPPMSNIADNDPLEDYNCNSVKNDYLLLHDSFQANNPDLRRSTPPRKGAFRLFDNPFDGNEEECGPISPESLSPNHIFEAPGAGGTIARLASNRTSGDDNEEGNAAAAAESNNAYELDYEKLMMFFEALKESSA